MYTLFCKTTLWDKYYNFPYFIDKETKVQKLNVPLTVKQ